MSETEVMCPECKAPMVLRESRRGSFYGCSRFPRCRGTREATDQSRGPMKASKGWANVPKGGPAVELLKGSEEQEAIWDFILHDSKHGCIDAVAGSGKSTTLIQAVMRLPRTLKIGMMAFNVHIARELQNKLTDTGISHARAFTYNSFGWRSVRTAFPGVTLDDDKMDMLIREFVPEIQQGALASPVEKLVGLLKAHLYHDATDEQISELIDRFEIEFPDEMSASLRDYTRRVLQESVKRTAVVDYDDQIYLTVKEKLPVEQFDILMVDEFQDTNTMQQELAMQACQRGRIIIVGDRNQAIYGFRGADVNAIPRMVKRLSETERGCRSLPLTISRRCPKLHVQLVQSIVPQIRALPEAKDGSIEILPHDEANRQMKPGDLVICRVNAPLIQGCYSLIRAGMKAIVRGRDIGKGLLGLIRRLRAKDVTDLIEKIREYENKEMEKLSKYGKKGASRIAAMQDRVQCIIELADGVSDLMELQSKIDRIFSDFDESGRPKDAVVFSTVHRGKGLEAQTIFVLAPELIPHPMASMEWEREQEANLAYVAGTRSLNRLVFIGQLPPAFGGESPSLNRPRRAKKSKRSISVVGESHDA